MTVTILVSVNTVLALFGIRTMLSTRKEIRKMRRNLQAEMRVTRDSFKAEKSPVRVAK